MHPPRPTSRMRAAGHRAVGLLLCAGLAGGALAACGGEPIAVQDVPSPAGRTTPARTPSGSPAPAPTRSRSAPTPTSSAPTPSTGASGGAHWSLPSAAEGWEPTIQDEDGLNQLTKSHSCNYTSSQNLFSPSGNGDRADSEDLARQWEDSISSQSTDVQSTMSDSEDIRSSPSGETIEMVRIDSTYTRKDVALRATTWVRAFTTIDTPTAVILTYTCQTGSYSATEMKQLLDDTAVVGSGPAKMDDGRPSGTSPDKT